MSEQTVATKVAQSGKNVKTLLLLVSGAFVGFVNGFFGGGGGMLVVPILVYFFGFSQRVSQASAISLILPISVVSAVTYFVTKTAVFDINMFACVGVLLGGILGAVLLKFAKNDFLRVLFILVMLASGIKMLF